MLFHDDQRVGPVVYAGALQCTKKPKAGMWAVYGALTGDKGRFHRAESAEALIRRAVPTEIGRKRFPWVEEVRWHEQPLGAITTAAQLEALIKLALAITEGNEAHVTERLSAVATTLQPA